VQAPREGKSISIILAVGLEGPIALWLLDLDAGQTTTGPRFSFFLSDILVPAIAGRRRTIIMDNLRAHFHPVRLHPGRLKI